jgi:hypothetical protein
MKSYLDKLGSFGAVIAAAACPICFPKLALLGAFFGLGGLAAYESQLIIAAQALVVLAAAGHVIAHRSKWLLGVALAGAIAFFAGLYVAGAEVVAYGGLAALVAASAIDLWRRLPRRPRRESVLTCPGCGHRSRETMPVDACLFFYDCKSCGAKLRPKPGDCCVFCSYGSVRCPPMQAA